jgi:hypothetical protein
MSLFEERCALGERGARRGERSVNYNLPLNRLRAKSNIPQSDVTQCIF